MTPEKLVADIIKEQSLIIGEQLAKSRAEDTGAVRFNSTKIDDIVLSKDPAVTLDRLVKSYAELFGQASVEVCLNVIKRFPADATASILPESLKSKVN